MWKLCRFFTGSKSNQPNNEVKDKSVKRYYDKAMVGKDVFITCTISHIPRANNKKAGVLSKLAAMVLRNVAHAIHMKVLEQPSVNGVEVNTVTTEEQVTWMILVINYLQND
jgi:hypothetical protein